MACLHAYNYRAALTKTLVTVVASLGGGCHGDPARRFLAVKHVASVIVAIRYAEGFETLLIRCRMNDAHPPATVRRPVSVDQVLVSQPII